MTEAFMKFMDLWEFCFLPILLWWSVICVFLVCIAEFEYRQVDRNRVEHRASLWRMTAVLSLVFPLLIWFSPVGIQVSIPSLRAGETQFIRSWQAHPSDIQGAPEGAEYHVFYDGLSPDDLIVTNPYWNLPGLPSLSYVADLSLPSPLVNALALLYGTGLTAFFGLQWYRKKRVRQFAWQTSPCDSQELIDLIHEKAQDFDIKKTIDVRIYDRAVSPCMIGGRNIIFVLPRNMVESWSREEIIPILIHELSHVRHGDLWYEWAVLRLKALLWFNPFVYWLAYRLDDTREALADAHALTYCQSTKEYAELLVQLAETMIHYPGMQAAHPFATPGKKTLRRLNRLKDVFSNNGCSFADLGYPVRILIWVSTMLLLAGIHTASPLIHMYSITEPHPDTSRQALTHLQEYRDWLNRFDEGYSLSASVNHRFYAKNPKTSEPLLLMSRDTGYQEWKDGSRFRKDIFGEHTLFPSLFKEDNRPPIGLASSVMNNPEGQFKSFMREANVPPEWKDNGGRFVNPFLQEKESSLQTWSVTRAHPNNLSRDIHFTDSISKCYYEKVQDIVRAVECGERIATLTQGYDEKTVTILPAFGTGKRIDFTITSQSKPMPSKIETWEDGQLLDSKHLSFASDGRLIHLLHRRDDPNHEYRYGIQHLEFNPPKDPSIFSTPELTQKKSPTLVFPAEEASYYFHSPRTFDQEKWALTNPPDFSPYAYVEGYFKKNNVHNIFYPIGKSRSRDGAYILQDLYALYDRPGAMNFERKGNRLHGDYETCNYTLRAEFSPTGKITKGPTAIKRITRHPFVLKGFSMEPRSDILSGKEEYKESISLEEFVENGEFYYYDYGFICSNSPNPCKARVGSNGHLGESPTAVLPLINFTDEEVSIESYKADSLVNVTLPKRQILPAHSYTIIQLQAPAGLQRRTYPVSFQLDHPKVKQLDVNFQVWPKG